MTCVTTIGGAIVAGVFKAGVVTVTIVEDVAGAAVETCVETTTIVTTDGATLSGQCDGILGDSRQVPQSSTGMALKSDWHCQSQFPNAISLSPHFPYMLHTSLRMKLACQPR